MATTAATPLGRQEPTRSKEGPSWRKDVTAVSASARHLIETYSGVAPDEVLQHALAIRERAWDVAPYGCVGMMGFTIPTIQLHPQYDNLRRRLGGARDAAFLDLGCGLGQNLRQLILDGAKADQLTGADLNKGLVQCGYDYFLDSSRLETEFLLGDVFNPDGDIGRAAQGKFDVVWAALFYHLWSWDGQLEALVATTKLLKPQPGSMVIGWQMGSSPAQEVTRERSVMGHTDLMNRVMYQQDESSWRRMGEELELQTGIKWKVEAVNDLPDWLSQVPKFYGNPNACRTTFTFTREG